jgi:CRP/FNR family transcriptional regulator, cyclic AMP receptor protein
MSSALWSHIFKKKQTEEERKLQALQSVNIFQGLTANELKEVEAATYTRQYRSGEYIFRQGNPGNGMYIILQGKVAIFNDSGNGVESGNILATVEEGNFLGEFSLLDEAPRSASAYCSENTEAITFFRGDLLDILNRKPLLGSKIILNVARALSERLRAANQRLQECEARLEQKND